jgi:hypothetical protein
MVRRREVGVVGTVEGEFGSPPQNLYAVDRIPVARATHDWFLTRYFQALGWPEVRRGRRVTPLEVRELREKKSVKFTVWPDAERRFPDGHEAVYEMDMATEDRADIDRKVRGYSTVKKFVLFLTVTDARLEKLKRWTEAGLKGRAFFALWREALAHPTGRIWTDHHGNLVALDG